MRPEVRSNLHRRCLRSSVPKLTFGWIVWEKGWNRPWGSKQVKKKCQPHGIILQNLWLPRLEVEVKQSMNEINAAQRKRGCPRIGWRTRLRLLPQPKQKLKRSPSRVDEQRKAIVDGLADSIKELKDTNEFDRRTDYVGILLTNQYLDTE